MVFSSVTFLFFFLPAALGAYYLVPRRARNAHPRRRQPRVLRLGRRLDRVRAHRVGRGELRDRPPPRAGPRRRRRAPRPALAGPRGRRQPRPARLVQVRQLRRRDVERGARRARGARYPVGRRSSLPIGISFYTFHAHELRRSTSTAATARRRGTRSTSRRTSRSSRSWSPARSSATTRSATQLAAPRERRSRSSRRRLPRSPGARARRSSSPTRSRPIANAAVRDADGRLDGGRVARRRSPTRSRSTSTSPATPTWRSGSR